MDPKLLAHFSQHLSLFRKIFKTDNVYIAGGALRDLDNGKEINDIDIFVQANRGIQKQAKFAIKEASKRLTYAGDLENIYGKKTESLIKDYATSWPTGLQLFDIRNIPHRLYPLQLILYNHPGQTGPRKLLDFFDINLCKISYDGARVHRANEYKADVEDKKITVHPYFVNNERTKQRLKKLERKFEGFEPVVPEAQSPRQRDPFTIAWDEIVNRATLSTSSTSTGSWHYYTR